MLSTDVFFAIVGAQFDQGRAASLALILSAFALIVFWAQQRLLGRTGFTTVTGKGDSGLAMPLPTGLRRLMLGIVLPWLAFTLVVYLFAFTGGFVATWGRDYTPTLRHFVTAFDIQRGNADVGAGLVFAGTAWNSLFTTLEAVGARGAALRRARPRDRLAAGANDLSRPQPVRVRAPCWRSRFPAPCSA